MEEGFQEAVQILGEDVLKPIDMLSMDLHDIDGKNLLTSISILEHTHDHVLSE